MCILGFPIGLTTRQPLSSIMSDILRGGRGHTCNANWAFHVEMETSSVDTIEFDTILALYIKSRTFGQNIELGNNRDKLSHQTVKVSVLRKYVKLGIY